MQATQARQARKHVSTSSSLGQPAGIPAFLDNGRKCWTLDSGRWTLDSRRWALDAGLWTLESGRWTLDSRHWTLDATLWTLGSGHWTLSLTVLKQNQNPVSDSAWLNYWKLFGCESRRTSWSRLFCRDYRFWRGYY